MKNFKLDDTIASISTPVGKGGIGIIRLSGNKSFKIADKIFLSKDKRAVKDFKSFTIHYGWIVNKAQSLKLKAKSNKKNKQNIIDEVLLSIMKSPKSYTTEDMVEINCHSGIIVLKKILDLVLNNGARLAMPGEFTRRAFINGRIDLAQAEAVLDIVESKTEKASELATRQLKGGLSAVINEFKEKLVEIYVQLEAAIDFPGESETMINFREIKNVIVNISNDIENIIKNARKGQLFREGRSLVICGKPNVGKSCLMNALLRKDRVIVTPIPGTTRDVIEESINIKGIPFRVIDTAGMISSNDIVEKEGIRRSKKHLENSDIVILVLDSSQQLNKEDYELIDTIKNKPHITVLNKIDLEFGMKSADIKELKKIFEKIVKISALGSKGIDNLEEMIINMVWEGRVEDNENILVTNQRHEHILKKAYQILNKVKDLSDNIRSIDLMALDVKDAIDYLGEIVGETYTEDLLDKIFSKFCIGK